jgi:2-C-methyl-D-erythritol 2,4-cyclodiphosphate synthase
LKLKAGIGYDIHRLRAGRKLILGGVDIPFKKGLLGHSDGDVVIHAVIDAMLGAMGEGDIGRLFPDTDPKYKGIRSVELLKTVMARLAKQRYTIVNIDTVIVAQAPKLGPYINNMKRVLTPILKVEKECLGIKAKTNEGLGPVGRGQAVAAWAIALLKK